MDVAILAGGLGTRLRGVWDGPKCLVPVDGWPIIERLLFTVKAIQPRTTSLLLGHRGLEVLEHLSMTTTWERLGTIRLAVVISPPEGTAEALRLGLGGVSAPLLVLNGDTLPRFSLKDMASFYLHNENLRFFDKSIIAWSLKQNCYAGAGILGADLLSRVKHGTSPDLDSYLLGAERYLVPGFLDVGTPEGFAEAQTLKGEDFDFDGHPVSD